MSRMAGKKNIVVVDLDGTLALDHKRNHYLQRKPRDWDAYFAECHTDEPNEPVIALIRAMKEAGYSINIVSGRRDDYIEDTFSWLLDYNIPWNRLQLRRTGDYTDDHILKLKMIEPFRNDILFVLEDRQRVVDMWRANGFTCLQVAPGNF